MHALGSDPLTFDDLVAGAAWVLLAVAAAWALVVLACVVVEAATDGRLRPARFTGVPPGVHRALLAAAVAALGVVVTTSPAGAEERAPLASRSTGSGIDGLPLPDRPLGRVVAATGTGTTVPLRPQRPRTSTAGQHDAATSRAAPAPDRDVVVRPGESLWAIASELLPAAPDRDLVAAVATLHRHNRHVVGPDPDRLRPGQVLAVPAELVHLRPREEKP